MEIFDRREDDNRIGGSNMSNVTSPRGDMKEIYNLEGDLFTGSRDSGSKCSESLKKNSYEDFDRVLRSALVGEERARAKILSMLDPLIRSSIKRY
ncbi:MAG: sigma-70 family RNA polymerase sigma factor, partial [Peptoniphilus harei]|nr:sigma-70 family RNA polymerase sigma factor [Peptoniphilus harei]